MTDGANEQTGTLVFKSQAGDYYLVSQETLERGRVAEEHTAEVERLISERDEDVRGHLADSVPIWLIVHRFQVRLSSQIYQHGWY